MPPGRPSKLTPDVAETIAAAVGKGLTIGLAARKANVDRTTVMLWLKKGREQERAGLAGIERDFFDRVECARATLAEAIAEGIKGARVGEGRDWRALAYFERTRLRAHLSDAALDDEAKALEGDDATLPGWRPVEPVRCPSCGAGTASDGGAPRFCSSCGAPLAPPASPSPSPDVSTPER